MQEHAGKVGAGSSCCVFLFVIFAAASPYWIWTYGWSNNGWGGGYSATLGTGVFSAGYTSQSTNCGAWYYCYSTTQVQWTDNLDSACDQKSCPNVTSTTGQVSKDCFDGSTRTTANCLTPTLEKYGMCENGKFTTPSQITQTMGLTVAACVLSGLAVIFAIIGREGGTMASIAGVCMLATAGCTCAAFSIYVSWDYAKAVNDGTAGVILSSGDNGCAYAMSSTSSSFGWGPAWGFMVAAFILSLFNTCIFFMTGGLSSAKNNGDGDFGGGKYI